jgi:MFS family permease
LTRAVHRTFDSLHVPNYRRYFAGQVVSVSGNWIQNVAAMWLMVQLTGDGLAVGLTAALQFLPLMLFGAWGGLLADRVDKRRLLIGTQIGLMIPAIVLAATTFAGVVTPLIIYLMVFLRGTAMAIDNPARQALPIELVGPERVVNAVALNSVVIQSSRIIGPGIAGLLIAVVGIAWCFVVDALSFVAMIVALLRLDPTQMGEAPRSARHKGALREGVRYVRGAPTLLIPLAMMGVIGLLSFNFQIVLPLMAHETWKGTATTFTLLTMTMAVGSVVGALVAGNRREITPRLLVGAATLFGVFQLLAAVAPTLPLQVLPLVLLGMASVTFSAGVNSTLQLQVDPAMRGRVMALYSLVFLGSTPIGAPLVGWIAGWAGPRAGMAIGGVAALLAAAGAFVAYRRFADRVAADEEDARRARESASDRRDTGRMPAVRRPAHG